jgi:hypothetical protein
LLLGGLIFEKKDTEYGLVKINDVNECFLVDKYQLSKLINIIELEWSESCVALLDFS